MRSVLRIFDCDLLLMIFASVLLAPTTALAQDLNAETGPATEPVASETVTATPEPTQLLEATTVPQMSQDHEARKRAIERCLAIYYTIQVDADVLRPWSIMHGLIAFGDQTLVVAKGQRVNAVEYLCANGIGDDRRLLLAPGGRLRTNVGRGFQGHEGQLLAMLAQASVSSDFPVTVDHHPFSVADLIRYEMLTCKSNTELTFKLLGLSHYLDSDAVWKDNTGQQWDFSRLLKEELDSPIDETTSCGGTHRLMAVSRAIANRKQQGKPFDSGWIAAEDYLKKFRDFAFTFQNKNGSFSTKWFRSRENDPDINRRLYTTGHVLEWLVYSSSDTELQDQRISQAVDYVVNLMMTAPHYKLDVGPRGHAIHALRMYEGRMYGVSNHKQLMGSEFARHIEQQNKQMQQAAREIQIWNGQQQNYTGSMPAGSLPLRQQPMHAQRRGIFGLRR